MKASEVSQQLPVSLADLSLVKESPNDSDWWNSSIPIFSF